MNYLSDQNYLNRRAKVWKEYAPFYLDYWDTLSCGFEVMKYEWLSTKQRQSDNWDNYRLLCVSNSNNINTLEIVDVKYPNSTSAYLPEELINTDCKLTSFNKQETRA